MKNIFLHSHPQLSYLVRIIEHIIKNVSRNSNVTISSFGTCWYKENFEFISWMKRNDILREFAQVNKLNIFFHKKTFGGDLENQYKYLLQLNNSEISFLLASSIDSLMKDKVDLYHRLSPKNKEFLIIENYNKALNLYKKYLTILIEKKIDILYVSHGNYFEYNSLILAAFKLNCKIFVFHGGTAHRYEIKSLDYGQPGPVNSFKQIMSDNKCLYKIIQKSKINTDLHIQNNLAVHGGRMTKNSLIYYINSLLSDQKKDYLQLLNSKQSSIIIIALHCLKDQNHNFKSESNIFRTYLDWTVETLKHVDQTCKVVIKIHPHSVKFNEYDLIIKLIKKISIRYNKKFDVIGPFDNFSKYESLKVCPLVISCGGSIAMEMSFIGAKCVTVTESFVDDILTLRFRDYESYVKSIGNVSLLRKKIKESMNNDLRSNKDIFNFSDIPMSKKNLLKLKIFDKFFFFNKRIFLDGSKFLNLFENYLNTKHPEEVIESKNVSLICEI